MSIELEGVYFGEWGLGFSRMFCGFLCFGVGDVNFWVACDGMGTWEGKEKGNGFNIFVKQL